MKSTADTVIVGAGPVGLWDSIQILQRRPDRNIQLYERHAEYVRNHTLRLIMLSTVLYSKSSINPRKNRFYQEIFDQSLTRTFGTAVIGGSVFIRTKALETALKSYAIDLGAQIEYLKIESPGHAHDLNPDCKKFIAADGAKSPMRQALLGSDNVAMTTTPLQHIVEIKYEAEGQPGRLHFLDDLYKTNKILSHVAFEYVGKEKDGMTPVNVRFFLDPETFDAVPESTYANPLKLDSPDLPPSLAKDLITYLGVRASRAHEKMITGSEKIGKLKLSAYVANQWAIEKDDTLWCLSGDSGQGVPFFRALNAGFFSGSQLGFILTRDLSLQNMRRAYNTMRILDNKWEFTVAHSKNNALRAFDAFRRASAASPIEVFKFGREEIEEFESEPKKIIVPSRDLHL